MPLPTSALAAALFAFVGPAAAAAVQDAGLDARAHAIHARALVLDSHVDIPLDYGSGAHDPGLDGDTQIDLPKLERGGVDAAVLAVFVQQGPRTPEGFARARHDADAKLAAIRAIPARYPSRAELALSAADVERIHRAHKVAILVGFLNAYPFGRDAAPIDDYYRQGLRVFGLVHAGDNDFADSSRPAGPPAEEWGGLSPLGREAVARLNRLGVVIDISQLTSAGVAQVLALTTAPVIASHSGVRGMVESPRNLSDAELDALKRNGGVVQVVAFSAYLVKPPADYAERVRPVRARYGLPEAFARPADGADALGAEQRAAFSHELSALLPRASVADLADSIDYAVKRIGVDHVGISSDFNHGGGIDGWANEGEAENVTRELVRRGYGEAEIDKLWGGNFLRVMRQVEAAARRRVARSAGG